MKRAAPTLAAALLLTACAAAPTTPGPDEPSHYVTGSRIPRKGADPAVSTVSKQDFERARNEGMLNPPSPQRGD